MRLPSGYCGFYLFTFIIGASFGGAQVFGDPDTAWHLATGDLIRSLGAIPLHDTWSFSAQDATWYNLSWLFDIGLSYLFSLGGFSLLYTLILLIYASAYTFMAHQCIKRGASIIATSITLFLALVLSFNSLLARPNLCSVVFTIIFYQLLCGFRDRQKAKPLLFLPFLMALWANMHGGFLLAFPIMGVFMLEALLAGNRTARQIYGALIAFCLCATLVNPYGYEVYLGAFQTLLGHFDKEVLSEWQPAKIGKDIPQTLLLLTVLVSGNFLNKRIPLSDRVLAIAMLVMALGTLRHGPVAAALMMPYISINLSQALMSSPIAALLRAKEQAIAADMARTDIKWMALIMAVIAIGLLLSPYPRDMIRGEALGFPSKNYPSEEAAFIEKKYPTLRFMNDYNLGGYLDYLWRGRVKVFIDGRASSLYNADMIQDYIELVINAQGYGAKAQFINNHYRFDGAIITHDSDAAVQWHWNPEWRLVYQGKVASVYLRNTTHTPAHP